MATNISTVIGERLVVADRDLFSRQQVVDRQRSERNDKHGGKKQHQRTDEHPELAGAGTFFLDDMGNIFIA